MSFEYPYVCEDCGYAALRFEPHGHDETSEERSAQNRALVARKAFIQAKKPRRACMALLRRVRGSEMKDIASMSNDELRQWMRAKPDPKSVNQEIGRCYERIGMNVTSDTSLNYYRERIQILQERL